MVLSGKDIELLLLKKDVQDKLMALGDIDIKCLPSTVNKTVQFLPGSVNFGQITDGDGVTLCGPETAAASKRPTVSHRATQTD
jgi:hypothetical protein